jgi:hypothetical protein
MNAVSAVFFFAVLRASLAGYGGMWFLPVVAGEAVNASLAFLCIAVGHWALRSLAKSDHDPAERVMHVATFAILFAAFGKGWIEPHIRLSSAFDVDSHLNPPLILIGALVGMASERLTRSLGVSARAGTLWATAGWLMVGPLLYANFDHIVAGRRLASAATIAATFAGLALVITALGRVFGAVRLRNFLMAVAAGALAFVAVGPMRTRWWWSSSTLCVPTCSTLRLDRRLIRCRVSPRLRVEAYDLPTQSRLHRGPFRVPRRS